MSFGVVARGVEETAGGRERFSISKTFPDRQRHGLKWGGRRLRARLDDDSGNVRGPPLGYLRRRYILDAVSDFKCGGCAQGAGERGRRQKELKRLK